MPKRAVRSKNAETYRSRVDEGFGPSMRLVPYGYRRGKDPKALVEVPEEIAKVEIVLDNPQESLRVLAARLGLSHSMVRRIRTGPLYNEGKLVRAGVPRKVRIVREEKARDLDARANVSEE